MAELDWTQATFLVERETGFGWDVLAPEPDPAGGIEDGWRARAVDKPEAEFTFTEWELRHLFFPQPGMEWSAE